MEFDAHKTKEATFAYQCDKLECDLQCKLYDEENCVDLKKQISNNMIKNSRVQKLLQSEDFWSTMWLKFSQDTYPYDENFRSISNYAMREGLKNNLNKFEK